MADYLAVRNELARRVQQFSFLMDKVRPASLASPFLAIAFPYRRTVTHDGIKLHIDPVSHLGRSLLLGGAYERETCELLRRYISSGDTVLDIGANEGFFSALAASLVGEQGCVVAVEPQSRLCDIVEINMALNQRCQSIIAQNAVDEVDGKRIEIALFPRSNTGASSIVHRYRWSRKIEVVETVTPLTLLKRSGRKRFNFVKIDVEGYEPEVVRALPLDLVGFLLVDYHASILKARNLDPAETDALIRKTHVPVQGTIEGGYALYRSAAGPNA